MENKNNNEESYSITFSNSEGKTKSIFIGGKNEQEAIKNAEIKLKLQPFTWSVSSISFMGNYSKLKRGGALQSYTTAELAADLGISKRQMEVNKYDRDDLIALASHQGLLQHNETRFTYTIGGL